MLEIFLSIVRGLRYIIFNVILYGILFFLL